MFKPFIDKIQENYFISFIYLYIFVIPWDYFSWQQGLLSEILVVWWFIIAKNQGYFKKLKLLLSNLPLMLLIIFVLYTFLSFFWSDNTKVYLESIHTFKYYLILIPIFYTTLKKENILASFLILLSSLFLFSLYSISIYLGLLTFEGYNPLIPIGYSSIPVVTPLIAIGTIITLILLLSQELTIKLKFIFFIIFSIFLFALFINQGRGAQLAFAVSSILIISILVIKHKNYSIIFAIFLVFILAYSFLNLNHSKQLQRYQMGFNELSVAIEKKDFRGSWGVRAYMWYAGAESIQKHPIFGAGAGDNVDEFLEYMKTHPSYATYLRTYHNHHLNFLTKYGIFGYILFWGSVLFLLISIRKHFFYMLLGVGYFSLIYIDGLADIIISMDPHESIFIIIFILLSLLLKEEATA